MASQEYPTTISGGCLCDSVRYEITFPASHDWKKSCSTCQCVQCRKNGGSLIAWLHRVPASSVAFTKQTTLSRYHATAGCARGFCSNCGSWMFWRQEDADVMSMAVGTLDKEVLRRWGKVLAHSEVQIWWEDAIEGATDHLKGERWKKGREGEGAERVE
ncbi:hypothetical protein FZEAL_4919 [Fusarium zealandicum]|uniref:CENP-V/GFA domain-containing protein n=1 Tax=Fusarium zealandicum TaxID=1053134 RepID=A0A8H4XKY9_9HYPO|nr:hypothetical protein FZEAL_4919 [Fusarium zealandicum]